MKIVLRCKNDVCVGALFVNFTMLYFTWFVSHFTVNGIAVPLINNQQ